MFPLQGPAGFYIGAHATSHASSLEGVTQFISGNGVGKDHRAIVKGFDSLPRVSLLSVPTVVESSGAANLPAGVVGDGMAGLLTDLNGIPQLAPHDGNGWTSGGTHKGSGTQRGNPKGVLEKLQPSVVTIVLPNCAFSPLGVQLSLALQH